MKNVILDESRPSYTVEEPAESYRQLLSAARRIAVDIVRIDPGRLTGCARYIHRVSEELLNAVHDDGHDAAAGDGAIFECLRRLGAVWPDVASGSVEGEQVFSDRPGLWKRAMTDYPMGGFARMTADWMIEHELLDGPVLELGAGVGSCSALVADHVSDDYVRSDLQPFLLKRQQIRGTIERYDFNERGRWRDLRTIFAVNALHCAKDKVTSLRHLHEMLRTGGVVVLGEGRPYTDSQRTPWALNGFFGLFRGWWDIGGFVPREGWLTALREAGFSGVGFASRVAGDHDLGGIIWGVK
jgi:hypothetical protein